MTVWPGMPDASSLCELWEARLRDAEQERFIRRLQRRATRPLWARILALLDNKPDPKPVLHQELTA